MSRRLSTLLIWACVAASAVFWTLRLLAAPQPVPQSARLASTAPAQSADWGRLLGVAPPIEAAAAAPSPAASRFRLVGVAAAGAGPGQAVEVALISVDGKPPRAFRIGQTVGDDYLLSGVTRQGATLTAAASAQAAAPIVLEMPLPTASGANSIGSLVTPLPATAPAAATAVPPAVAAPEMPPQTTDLRNSPLAR